MNISKQLWSEIYLALLFLATTWGIYWSIAHIDSLTLTFVYCSVLGILYVSSIGWYSALKKKENHIDWLILVHALILFTPTIMTGLTFVLFFVLFFFTIFFCIMLAAYFQTIDREISERLFYYPHSLVRLHINRVVISALLMVSLLVYFQVLDTTSQREEFSVPETLVSQQATALEPLIQGFVPSYKANQSIRDYVARQINTESIQDSLPSDLQGKLTTEEAKDRLIEVQIRKLERDFNIEIEGDDSIETLITARINQFIEKRIGVALSPIILASISSFLVLFGLSTLIPLYSFCIRLVIQLMSYLTVKTKVVKTEVDEVTKHTLTI